MPWSLPLDYGSLYLRCDSNAHWLVPETSASAVGLRRLGWRRVEVSSPRNGYRMLVFKTRSFAGTVPSLAEGVGIEPNPQWDTGLSRTARTPARVTLLAS